MATTEADQRQTVTLVKTSSTAGHLQERTTNTTKHNAGLSRDEARVQAFRRLIRSCPDENPGDWEELPDGE